MTTEAPQKPQPKLLTRNDLIGSKGRRFETVPLPWDEDQAIRVRSLTDGEQSEYELGNLNEDGTPSSERLQAAKRRLVALCLVDEKDQPILTADDVAAMEQTDGKLIAFAFQVAQKHCNIEFAGEKKALIDG